MTILFRTTVLAVFQTNNRSRTDFFVRVDSSEALMCCDFACTLWLNLWDPESPLQQYQCHWESRNRAGARAGQGKSGNIVLNKCTLVHSLNTHQPCTPFSSFTKGFHCTSSIIAYQQLWNAMINHCPEDYKTFHVFHCLCHTCCYIQKWFGDKCKQKNATKTNCWCCTTAVLNLKQLV